MSRCWPVRQLRFSIWVGKRSSSAISGAILIASGRVPKTVRTLSIGAVCARFEPMCVEKVFHGPADLGFRDVLGALSIASVEAAGAVLDFLEVAQRKVRGPSLPERVPYNCVLGDPRRADPFDVRISGDPAVAALAAFDVGHSARGKLEFSELAQRLHRIRMEMRQPVERDQLVLPLVVCE